MIYFASWDDSDTGEPPLDYESLQIACDDHTHQIHSATKHRDVLIGLNPLNRYDFEIWADGGLFYKKREDGAVLMDRMYFSTFEELRAKAMELEPDGRWEEVGWR